MTRCCPPAPPPRCAHLSPARHLAHAELARLNLERFEREKEECTPDERGDVETARFFHRAAGEFNRAADEAFRREIERMEDGWDEP